MICLFLFSHFLKVLSSHRVTEPQNLAGYTRWKKTHSHIWLPAISKPYTRTPHCHCYKQTKIILPQSECGSVAPWHLTALCPAGRLKLNKHQPSTYQLTKVVNIVNKVDNISEGLDIRTTYWREKKSWQHTRRPRNQDNESEEQYIWTTYQKDNISAEQDIRTTYQKDNISEGQHI